MSAAQAFELNLAPLIERDVPGAFDEAFEERGNQYLPPVGLRGDACGDDDVLAEEVLLAFGRLLFDGLAGVEAHAYADGLLRTLVSLREGELDRDSAVERLARGLEGDHEAVALALDLEAAVLVSLERMMALCSRMTSMNCLSPRRSAICGGAFDVAEHDGDGAVRRGVRAEVGLLFANDPSDGVERGVDVAGGDALELQLEAHCVFEIWPGRGDRSFALRWMLDDGVRLAMGSDAPVARLDPWLAMAAAVHRTADDREAWHPEQSITPREALAASTDGWGTVAEGHPADLALLDTDPLAHPADDPAVAARHLRETPVAATWVAGEPVHAARCGCDAVTGHGGSTWPRTYVGVSGWRYADLAG